MSEWKITAVTIVIFACFLTICFWLIMLSSQAQNIEVAEAFILVPNHLPNRLDKHAKPSTDGNQPKAQKENDRYTQRWEIMHTLEAPNGVVWVAEFSPDGKQLLTGSLDGKAQIWDVRNG